MPTYCAKETPKSQVTRYCRGEGIACNGKGGIPLLSKGAWLECFDSWSEAMQYICKARTAHFDLGKPYPWNAD
jgi:hypothetical protein